MEKTTVKTPIISNWNDVREQFGTHTSLGPRYKTAVEISKELSERNRTFVVEKDPGFNSIITVDVERDNFDSAIAMFQYKFTDKSTGQRVFDYSGTAK